MSGKLNNKYQNTGEYNKELINLFCNTQLGLDFIDEMARDEEFLDYIWEILMLWCSSKRVYQYLINCREQRDKQNGIYQPFQADCLLETFTDIYRMRLNKPYTRQRVCRRRK